MTSYHHGGTIPSFVSLYRHITRRINQLPLDQRTVSLLHQYKRYKYKHTKIKNNELYYENLNLYYLNVLDKVIKKQDDEKIQELLTLAYLKTVPTKKRFPKWYMDFVNLDKNDVEFIYNHDVWPVNHLIITEAKKVPKQGETKNNNNKKNNNKKKKNDLKEHEILEFHDMVDDYKLYLQKQKIVKDANTSVLELFPHIKATDENAQRDLSIDKLISKSLEPLKQIPDPQIKIRYYSNLIKKLSKFVKQVRQYHFIDYQKLKFVELKQSPTPFGLPIAKCRSRNKIINKVKYYKNLMYYKLEPLSMDDFKYLESIVDEKPDIKTEKGRIQQRVQKRYKNFLKVNYFFANYDGENDDVMVFSKYRVLKVNYYESLGPIDDEVLDSVANDDDYNLKVVDDVNNNNNNNNYNVNI